jgi:hypothetical protein
LTSLEKVLMMDLADTKKESNTVELKHTCSAHGEDYEPIPDKKEAFLTAISDADIAKVYRSRGYPEYQTRPRL